MVIIHTCHAKGCSKLVKPELLCCHYHWKLCPKKLQLEVWKHYRNGQCDDKNPSEVWVLAADNAIRAIFLAEQEIIKETKY